MPLDHFDLIAPLYVRVRYRATEKMRELAALPVKGRLLDVGGGTGRVALALPSGPSDAAAADILVVSVSTKPLSYLVWLGAVIMLASAFLSVVRRSLDLKRGAPPAA